MTETNVLAEVTATYQPKTGGIHPREAAQHHATHIASVIRKVIESAGGSAESTIHYMYRKTN